MATAHDETLKVGSPVQGWVTDLAAIGDAAFASGALGQGVAILPEGLEIAAPIAGTVVAAFPTGHAFGLQSKEGLEVLVHIGLDTVKLKGEHFTPLAQAGQWVDVGTPLARVDLEKVALAGYDTSVIVVVTNSADFSAVEPVAAGTAVQLGDTVTTVTR